ncbi:hypothetical protein FACS1894184_20360 [Clostridia bacterium]|nr:hypothetical protein FACS1894184_20360 [Clostridia bacterium]
MRLTIETLMQPHPYSNSRAIRGGCVFTLGTFDGLHAAHMRLLSRAKHAARLCGQPLVVMTFHKNPLEVLSPTRAPRALMTQACKLTELAAAGVDETIICTFSAELAALEPDDLIESIVRCYHPTDWFVGFNNTFGRAGTGTPKLLLGAGDRLGFRTHVMPAMIRAGSAVSSSRIRAAVLSGDLQQAQELLGRCYMLQGFVSDKGVLTVSDRLALPAAGSYNVLLDGAEYTLRLIPRRLGPPGPPTDALVPVGRILPGAAQPMPSGIKRLYFIGKSLTQASS